MYVCGRVHVYTHTHIHTYIHTHTHTYIHAPAVSGIDVNKTLDQEVPLIACSMALIRLSNSLQVAVAHTTTRALVQQPLRCSKAHKSKRDQIKSFVSKKRRNKKCEKEAKQYAFKRNKIILCV